MRKTAKARVAAIQSDAARIAAWIAAGALVIGALVARGV